MCVDNSLLAISTVRSLAVLKIMVAISFFTVKILRYWSKMSSPFRLRRVQ